jgi:hypothetical protein
LERIGRPCTSKAYAINLEDEMDLNTATIGATFLWAAAWIFLPEKVLNNRPTLKRVFFALGILLGIAFLFVLLSGHQ